MASASTGRFDRKASSRQDVNHPERVGDDIFFRLSEELLLVTDSAGAVIRANPAWETLLGWKPAEIAGIAWQKLFHGRDLETAVRWMERPESPQVCRMLCRDGGDRWVRWRLICGDRENHWAGLDITAERARQGLIQFLFDQAPVMLHALDPEFRICEAGDSFRDALGGVDPSDVLGKHASEFLAPASGERLLNESVPAFLRDGMTRNNRYTFKRADGTTFEGLVCSRARFDDDERFAGAISVITDITELEEAREALEFQTTLLKRSQSVAHVGHWRESLADRFLEWSDEAFNIHGQDRETFDLTPDTARILFHHEDRQAVQDVVEAAITKGEDFEVEARIVRPDGEVRWVRRTGEIVEGPDGKAASIFGVFVDLTDAKLANRNRQLFTKAMDGAGEASAFIRSDGSFSYVNELACVSTGYTQAELLEKHIFEIDVGQGQDFSESWALLKKLGALTFETTHRRKDGTTFPVEMAAEYLTFEGEEYICGRARNIEARRRHEEELERAKETAEAAVKARDHFLAMMSHEIRTPMNGVIGMASLLRETELTGEQLESVEVIRTSGSDLLTIINDILDFSKVEAGKVEFELQTFALRQCLNDGIGLMSAVAQKKGLDLSITFDDNVPEWITSDSTRIRQVLVNLVANAVKFTDKGWVKVNVWAETEGDANTMLGMTVSDSGIGIPAEQVGRLFEPFVQADATMTRRFGGTGLGLAICRRLCEGLGGEIAVESEEGEGSAFTMTIPVQAASAPAGDLTWTDSQSARETDLRILLAEDNPINQRVALRMLERMGYEAAVASDGLEVLEAVSLVDYDVILMDVRMPGLDGLEATRRIRALGTRQPYVIALTANAMSGDREQCKLAGMNDFVAKPMVYSALEAALGKVRK